MRQAQPRSQLAEPRPTEPTKDQLENCKSMGWDYLGDGIFAKDDSIGWFEGRHFVKG